MAKAKKVAKGNTGKPKLKTILVDPYKTTCPVLNANELEELRQLLNAAIAESGLEPRSFLSANHIHLGLQSSLRAINNRQASCVLISVSIKPKFVIGLIGRNVTILDETVPVFAQPKLEDFTKDVFGIETLAMVLPLQLQEISSALQAWVQSRRKPNTILKEDAQKPLKVCRKRKTLQPKEDTKAIISRSERMVIEHQQASDKSWSGDFISFNNEDSTMKIDELALDEDRDGLVNALGQLTKKAEVASSELDTEAADIDVGGDSEVSMDKVVKADTDSDDFLEDYKSLTVQKIKPNPNKKPKKKRKKNKAKQGKA